MAEQDNVKAARGLIEAFNINDWAACKAAMTPDSVYDEVATGRQIRGSGDVLSCWQAWKVAMPDVKGTIHQTLPVGNTVVVEVTWAGTHTGPLQGPAGTIPATGKKQSTRAGWVMNFEGGKLKDSRHYFDMLAFMQQLGLIPREVARDEAPTTGRRLDEKRLL
jgi:steroid delta-isomerase-like uncharacterized protein